MGIQWYRWMFFYPPSVQASCPCSCCGSLVSNRFFLFDQLTALVSTGSNLYALYEDYFFSSLEQCDHRNRRISNSIQPFLETFFLEKTVTSHNLKIKLRTELTSSSSSSRFLIIQNSSSILDRAIRLFQTGIEESNLISKHYHHSITTCIRSRKINLFQIKLRSKSVAKVRKEGSEKNQSTHISFVPNLRSITKQAYVTTSIPNQITRKN